MHGNTFWIENYSITQECVTLMPKDSQYTWALYNLAIPCQCL